MSGVAGGWIWLVEAVTLAIHEEQLVEHGGAMGLRYVGLLEFAVAQPANLAAYGQPDAAALAAGDLEENTFADWLRGHLQAR